MRTDDFGHEIGSAQRKTSIFQGCGRLFTLGIALGVGLGLGFGPPLPLVEKILPQAVAGEPAQPAGQLPRQWLVLRNALLDPSVTGITYAEQRQDEELLRGKWLVLRDALESSWQDRISSR